MSKSFRKEAKIKFQELENCWNLIKRAVPISIQKEGNIVGKQNKSFLQSTNQKQIFFRKYPMSSFTPIHNYESNISKWSHQAGEIVSSSKNGEVQTKKSDKLVSKMSLLAHEKQCFLSDQKKQSNLGQGLINQNGQQIKLPTLGSGVQNGNQNLNINYFKSLELQTHAHVLLSSPKAGDLSSELKLLSCHSSNQKKRQIRVQSKNKFPSDFFQQSHEQDELEEEQEESTQDHQFRPLSNCTDYNQTSSHSTNKQQQPISHPMKLSLPIPSGQSTYSDFSEKPSSQKQINLLKNIVSEQNKSKKISNLRPISSQIYRSKLSSELSPQKSNIGSQGDPQILSTKNQQKQSISRIDGINLDPKSVNETKNLKILSPREDIQNQLLSPCREISNKFKKTINNKLPSHKSSLSNIGLSSDANQLTPNYLMKGKLPIQHLKVHPQSSHPQNREKSQIINASTNTKKLLTNEMKIASNNNLNEINYSKKLTSKEKEGANHEKDSLPQNKEEKEMQLIITKQSNKEKSRLSVFSNKVSQNEKINKNIINTPKLAQEKCLDNEEESKLVPQISQEKQSSSSKEHSIYTKMAMQQYQRKDSKTIIDFPLTSKEQKPKIGTSSPLISPEVLTEAGKQRFKINPRSRQRPQSMKKLNKMDKTIEDEGKNELIEENIENLIQDSEKQFESNNQQKLEIEKALLISSKQTYFLQNQEINSKGQKNLFQSKSRLNKTEISNEVFSELPNKQNPNNDSFENYNKTANFSPFQNVDVSSDKNIQKQLKSQPKLALNSKESEKYKPFLIRKINSQSSTRVKPTAPSTNSPNSSNSFQTFNFEFNKNFSGSTNPGRSQLSSPTLIASNDLFNLHEFSFSNQ